MVTTSQESWTLVPSVAFLLQELLLLGPVGPTLCFKGRASDLGSLTRGQVLGSFTSYPSHSCPKPTALSCLHYLLRRLPACTISLDAEGPLCPEQLHAVGLLLCRAPWEPAVPAESPPAAGVGLLPLCLSTLRCCQSACRGRPALCKSASDP